MSIESRYLTAYEYRGDFLDKVILQITIGIQGLLGNTQIRFIAYAEARRGYRG